MASVMSTVLSRLNAFLDTELEQVICYDSPINAEMFASEKCAIFLILPEEDPAKNFIAGLMIQNLSRELFSVADEHDGRLKNRVVLFCDELGTMPPFDILPLFSAGRSRGLTLVPIIQSLAQLEKNYGKEGAEIICDNCQDPIFGGFSPQSKTAEDLSHREKTVYIYLRDRADASGVCWPGIKTITGELGLSPRTVQRALADLEHRQLIEKRQRHRANGSLTSNLYRLTAAKKSQSPAKGGL